MALFAFVPYGTVLLLGRRVLCRLPPRKIPLGARLHIGQITVTILVAAGSVLSDN
jgi:hypothetical protein